MKLFRAICIAASLTAAPVVAHGQSVLDRAVPVTPRPDQGLNDPGAARAVPIEIARAAPRPVAGPGLFVGAIVISGLKVLSPQDFSDIVSQFVGRQLAPADLSDLATRIALRARERGYKFATAAIAPQRLTAGVLTVSMDEGAIDELRFEGAEQAAVRATLQPLACGQPVRYQDVERRLLLAQDVAAVRVLSSRFIREHDRGVLIVHTETRHITGQIVFTNDGTRPLGPEQIRVDVNLAGLFAPDDSLSFSIANSIAQPGELHYERARYVKRVSPSGTEVSLAGSISSTHPGSYLAPLDIDGQSWLAALAVSQPLARSRASNLWARVQFDLRDLKQSRAGIAVRHDRIAAVRLGLSGSAKLLGGWTRANATLSQGVDLFGATRPGDPLASRSDADGRFTALDLWADWTKTLAPRTSVRVAAEGQLASKPLLVSEEAQLGGTFLRGYDWSERTGDRGAMASAELRYDAGPLFSIARRVQVYAYADAGKVTNLRGGFGGGSLASAGGGVRADLVHGFALSAELAVPLSGPRYDTGDKQPRLNIGISRAF